MDVSKLQKKPRLVYIYPDRSSFVVKDIEIFSASYEVIELPFKTKPKWLLPFRLVWQACMLLIYRFSSRIFVVQFGGYHSLFPALIASLTGGKSCIVLGGYDAVAIPEISYGAFANKWMRMAVSCSYRWTNLLLPVHESLMQNITTYGVEKPQHRGVLNYLKNLKTKYTTVYNGYDSTGVFKTSEDRGYPKTVITIAAGCAEKRRQILKGVDLVLATAPLLPDFNWIIVGDELPNLPSNVKAYPVLSPTKLAALMRECSVVVQVSLSEGFPNALCEAMIAGCVPVISPVAAMPQIVGSLGETTMEKSPTLLAEAVIRAFEKASMQHTQQMKDHIERNFSFDRRKKELLKELSQLLQ